MTRAYNFSAGPAALPLPVLQKAQQEMLELPGAHASVMEISHRSKNFTDILDTAKANYRKLLDIPEDYEILFQQGGAQMQFAMIPMNFLGGKAADYVITGTWGKAAATTATTQGEVNVICDTTDTNFNRLPKASELQVSPDSAYTYYCTNETIQGVQFPADPPAFEGNDAPIICDASSELLSRPVPVSKFGMIYACAQKNCGPAGVTVVIIRKDLIERSPDNLSPMLSYKVQAKANSLFNTPPTFAVYIAKLVTDWLLERFGSLTKVAEFNERKAGKLYDVIDSSDGFYLPHAEANCRSKMNVPFKLRDDEKTDQFLSEAAAESLVALKGHRSVGGMRASIYNAMTEEGVDALCDFMLKFQKAN